MGLDWNPGNRGKPGHEAEFVEVLLQLEGRAPTAKKSSLGKIGGLFKGERPAEGSPEREALLARFNEITQDAFETLQAPRVGHDDIATDYARKIYAENRPDTPEAEWLAELEGFYVVSLIKDCDGVPRYSNGSPGGYVEPFSFRGQFLTDCTDIIGDDLLEQAYITKTPEEMMAYGKQLVEKAEDYAKAQKLDIEGVEPDDPESIEFRLDVVLRAGRWCLFWAERGHFLEAYW